MSTIFLIRLLSCMMDSYAEKKMSDTDKISSHNDSQHLFFFSQCHSKQNSAVQSISTYSFDNSQCYFLGYTVPAQLHLHRL